MCSVRLIKVKFAKNGLLNLGIRNICKRHLFSYSVNNKDQMSRKANKALS